MSNPAARRASQILKAVPDSEKWGKAQKIWNTRATPEEKRKLLVKYCKSSPVQIRLAIWLPWSSLSLGVRKAMKHYFLIKGEDDPLYPEAAKKQKRKT